MESFKEFLKTLSDNNDENMLLLKAEYELAYIKAQERSQEIHDTFIDAGFPPNDWICI